MEEHKLDSELKRLYTKLPFLWKNYKFHVKYFTRDYGMYSKGFVIGLENEFCRIVFEKETASSNEPIAEYIGKKYSPFLPLDNAYFIDDGWYTLTGLLQWLTGVQCERDKNVERDLDNVSQYLQLYIQTALDLYKYPEEFDSKLEYYRNLNKENQLTVDKIKEERARLRALGQDWSLEAAITSLRGGKK